MGMKSSHCCDNRLRGSNTPHSLLALWAAKTIAVIWHGLHAGVAHGGKAPDIRTHEAWLASCNSLWTSHNLVNLDVWIDAVWAAVARLLSLDESCRALQCPAFTDRATRIGEVRALNLNEHLSLHVLVESNDHLAHRKIPGEVTGHIVLIAEVVHSRSGSGNEGQGDQTADHGAV